MVSKNLWYLFLTVNGNWGLWTDNGTCSKSCGAGTKTQIRQCDNPEPANGGSSCNGSSTQTVQCNTDLCPGIKFKVKLVNSGQGYKIWIYKIRTLFKLYEMSVN